MVLQNKTLSMGVHPPFGAYNTHDGLLYSIVPDSYTEYTLYSLSPTSGAMRMLK